MAQNILYLREGIQELIPYSIEEHSCSIKLDANESPFSIDWTEWPEITKELKELKLNRYPDPYARELKRKLSAYLKWPAEQMIIGNGSDELIQYIVMAFGGSGRSVYAPYPSFSMYKIISIAMGQEFREIPLLDGFDLPLESRLLMNLSDETQKIVFIASPNNPTGNCFAREDVLSVLKHTNGIVCIDEAYHDFSEEEGFLEHLPEFKNLIILRSLSKVGLAGLRIGMLIANDEVISAISKVKLPFNINTVSQFIASVVLNNKDIIFNMNKTIKENRAWLFKEMETIDTIKVFPSQANFILFECKLDVEHIYQELVLKGILIRMFPPDSKYPGFLRVTIGSKKECEIFVEELKKILIKMEKTIP